MFHRFPATPGKARRQTKGPQTNKRQKAARACDRCRLQRIKCDEQKPCRQCVGIKAKCVVSYITPDALPVNSSTTNTSPSLPALSHNIGTISQESSCVAETPLEKVHNDCQSLTAQLQGLFSSSQSFVFAGCIFPQLPHPALPSEEQYPPVSDSLLKSQRSYYLRLFWDVCHPLLQIMSENEFAELNALPPPTMFDDYSTRIALVDSMIALGIQHSHATGLDGRILGLQQPSSRQNYHGAPSSEVSWPGWEYFNRSRECMRNNKDMTLEALQCHTLMVLYLMKGNALRDAYNLLGITIRKAYMAKLHRPPPSHLPEAGRIARMQLWWTLFSMDLQCSLQLEMPPAIQKSLIKCPCPAEDALARYIATPGHRHEEAMNAYHTYSTCLVSLAVAVSDISPYILTASLDDEDGSNSMAAPELHAFNLSSVLHKLEAWRDQLPSELLLLRNQHEDRSGNAEMLDFDRYLSLPTWLQRQAVLLNLYYHNTYTLILRPFIRLRYNHSSDASDLATQANSSQQQPNVELQVASALHHATLIVDTVFAVCSTSDILYGWSEVLQPLWNATLTIAAYVYTNSLNSVVPRALDSLTRAIAIFESFSPVCPSALSAKDIVQPLVNDLQNMMLNMHGSRAAVVANDDSMGWDLFASLLGEKQQQTSPTDLEHDRSSNNFCGTGPFTPYIPSDSHINSLDFNFATTPFGDA